MRTIKQKLRQALSRRHKQRLADASRVPSAVLVPVYCKQGQYYILLTKRTELVKEHKGEISFPGGAYQKGDETLVNTALRECFEEVGLTAHNVEILGELDDAITKTSNYIISPFVGFIIPPYQFRANVLEIEEIIEVPISALLDKGCLRQETETIGDKAITSFSYYYQGRIIHGATARILNQFLDIFARIKKYR